MRRALVAVLALALVACHGARSKRPRFGSLRADAREFVVGHGVEVLSVDNGLTVALRPDPRTNLVSVDVRYLVGGAEDPPGRSGLAHLVEHLTFAARAEADGPTLQDELGESSLHYNAWTSADATHYTTIALAEQLSTVLALEARRMQVRCDRLDEATFLRERDVVRSEETWRHSRDHALRSELAAAVWGTSHPYARSMIDAEIGDASREEACRFLRQHYAPDRAILVVSGRFDAALVRAEIAERFGAIRRAATGKRAAVRPPELGGESAHVEDVDDATAIVVFAAPRRDDRAHVRHRIVAAMLEHALRELDEREAWITGADVQGFGWERAPVTAALVAVADPARLDDAVDRVFAAAATLAEWRDDEVDVFRGQVRTSILAAHDAFLGAGAWIADYLQYTEHHRFFLAERAEVDRVTPEAVAEHAASVLARERAHVARVRPSGRTAGARRAELGGARRDHDLEPWRAPVELAEATRPLETTATRIERRVVDDTLANGLRVLLAPDRSSALVEARLVFPHGSLSDPADRPGTAAAAARVIDHDRDRTYTSRERTLLRWALQLGTQLGADVDEHATTFVARGNATFADWHVWRLFWLLDAGVFADDRLAALHERARARRDDRRDDAALLRARLLAERLFGADHPRARPPASPDDDLAISRADLERFRDAHYRAPGAVLIVSGGFDPGPMRREIEELFGAWTADAAAPAPSLPAAHPAAGPSWLAVLDPEAAQVHVTIAFATTSDPVHDAAARAVLAVMLEDRVRVVREGLGASYGIAVDYGADGALSIAGELDLDRAGTGLRALGAAIDAVRAGGDAFAADFVRARRRALAAALADPAGASDLAAQLQALATRALPLSFPDEHAAAIAALAPDAVAAVAAADLADARQVVVVGGPRDAVTRALAAAGQTAEIYSSAAE